MLRGVLIPLCLLGDPITLNPTHVRTHTHSAPPHTHTRTRIADATAVLNEHFPAAHSLCVRAKSVRE